MRRLVSLVLAPAAVAAILFISACAKPAPPSTTGSPTVDTSTGTITPDASMSGQPSPTPSPADTTTSQVWQLRYQLLSHYRDFAYCDPDFYPVARDDEQSAADDWWSHVNRNSPEVLTILDHFGLRAPLTAPQRLAAYRDHKKLTVIAMKPMPGGYEYVLSTSVASGGEPDQTVSGVITFAGSIQERSRVDRPGGCPICLESPTRIATPGGEVVVTNLRVGDIVWTLDSAGLRVAAPIERIVHRATPGPHLMIRVTLSDGRALVAAGAHPATDGTYLRSLRAGQGYDTATVTSVEWVLSVAPATYDILPAGPSGAYWANGILVGSTLSPQPPSIMI